MIRAVFAHQSFACAVHAKEKAIACVTREGSSFSLASVANDVSLLWKRLT